MDRIVRLVLIGLVAAGLIVTGVSLAAGNSSTDKAGKGCGDRNHVHYLQSECK